MTITLTSATPYEIAPLQKYLIENFNTSENNTYTKDNLKIHCLITGVGQVKTAFHLASHFAQGKSDLYINAGIAGSYSEKHSIGSVVNVVTDRFGDLGVEEANGDFTDIYELDLIPSNEFPFIGGMLQNPQATAYDFLPKAAGITVNKVHGTQQSIDKIVQKYNPEVETMEGAAFAYACLCAGVDFLQIRAISNKVEPRNREGWKLGLAIGNLNEVLVEMIRTY